MKQEMDRDRVTRSGHKWRFFMFGYVLNISRLKVVLSNPQEYNHAIFVHINLPLDT